MLEYFGVITGLLYLLLEIRQHKAMWVVGFLTSLAYVFVFFSAKVYADMGLQVYYVLISIYGFYQWSRKGKSVAREGENTAREENTAGEGIVYRRLTWQVGLIAVLAILVLWLTIWFVLSRFTDSPIPVGDAFTTAAGIVATWMLAHYIIEHWLFWVVINAVSAYLYATRGLYPTLILYLCYTILAVVGWYNWKRKGVEANGSTGGMCGNS